MGFERTTVVRAADRLVAADLDDETVILGFDAGAYFGVGGVGRVVWEMLQAPTSVSALCDAVVARFDVDEATCFTDVQRFLASLEEEGLVTRVVA